MKKLILSVIVLGLLLIASPALAQETVSATGTLKKLGPTTYGYGTHGITDEETGVFYALRTENEDLLDSYVGQRVTIYGTRVPGYQDGEIEGGPDLLKVSKIVPAQSEQYSDPSPEDPNDNIGENTEVLPDTGGAVIPMLILGALLTASGLLIRRLNK